MDCRKSYDTRCSNNLRTEMAILAEENRNLHNTMDQMEKRISEERAHELSLGKFLFILYPFNAFEISDGSSECSQMNVIMFDNVVINGTQTKHNFIVYLMDERLKH